MRVLSGLLLVTAALGAVGAAVLVVVLHVGFAPVLSPSMSPSFEAGDLLVTRSVPTADVAVGDVVVLPRPDAPGERYAHRVISRDASGGEVVVRTKGDANPAEDPQALRIVSDTVPVAVGDLPAVGRAALLGQHAWVRVALIVLIGLAVLVAAKRALLRPAR
ncbi:signal peptidase I [Saccharothrix syringae]|uniref:signal peptidase I n=1 Tax=Saccharothrix syringae TaxID=103733 RepID=UPI00068D9868|nr:signal peptidase I [Saccharothrix syringae]